MKKIAAFLVLVCILTSCTKNASEISQSPSLDNSNVESQSEEPSKQELSESTPVESSEPELSESAPTELSTASVEKTSPQSTTPQQENQALITYYYTAYDYMGLSHKAVISDSALIGRINKALNYPGDGTETASPTTGGAVGISIEDGNTVKEFLFTSALNGEDVMYRGNFSSRDYYYLKDETLVKDLTDTYYNDNNKVKPIPKDEMSISFVYFDYVEKDMVIQGEEGRTDLEPGDDKERLKTVIASDISYKDPFKDPCLVGGEGIQIDTVISSREFRSYYLFKLQDGTVICRFNYGTSDEPLTEDRTFYVVSDTKVYDYIISTYFANINPRYGTQ